MDQTGFQQQMQGASQQGGQQQGQNTQGTDGNQSGAPGLSGGLGGMGNFNAAQLSALQGLGGAAGNMQQNMLAQLQQQQQLQQGQGANGAVPGPNGAPAPTGGPGDSTAQGQQQQMNQQLMQQQQQLMQQAQQNSDQGQQQGAQQQNDMKGTEQQGQQQANGMGQQQDQQGVQGQPQQGTQDQQQALQQQQQQLLNQQQQQQAQLGMMGGFNQNALLSAAAMGSGNMGFNLQQIQQLQLAQQLMAAGIPPNLAFGGMQQQNPLMAGFGNPMMNPFGGLAAAQNPASNPMAALNPMGGMVNAQSGAGAPGLGGLLGANGLASNPAGHNPLMAAAGLGGAKPEAAKTSAPSGKAAQPEWAEPFAGKGKKEPPFPLKLHQILSNPEFQECICWNPHGRSWRILKPPVFEQLVIPLYFRHAKYASFMRQVNGWGFKRIVSGNDHNSYFHELFLRDYPQLCLKMKRIRKGEKPTGGETADSDGDGAAEMVEEVIDGKVAGLGGDGKGEEGPDGTENTGEAKKGEAPAPNGGAPSSSPSLTGVGLNPGTTGLATAAPGYNALAALQGQMQGAGNPAGATMGANTQQQVHPNLQNNGNQAASAPGMDNSALLKLQEALKSSGQSGANQLLQQQQQQQPNTAGGPSGFNFSNLNFLQGPLGGALAAQLQAATQAPSRNPGEDGKESGGGAGAPSSQQMGQMNGAAGMLQNGVGQSVGPAPSDQ